MKASPQVKKIRPTRFSWRSPVTALVAIAAVAAPLTMAVTPASAAAPATVAINEVESNGGTPGDWIELINNSSAAVNLAGWKLKDNDDTHAFAVLPTGSTIAAGGYFIVEESTLGFGLGQPDSARLYSPDGAIADTYSWTTHAATTYGRCPNGTGDFTSTTTSTKGAANDCSFPGSTTVKINEVESSGGTPGDWIELINTSTSAVNIAGWKINDSDDTHTPYTFPTGSSIAAGGYFIVEEATLGNGLGAADSARLFGANGAVIDSYSWTAHAANTYGRCPNGTGAFANTASVTKGAANACAGDVVAATWPGGSAVANADASGVLGGNMSGLYFEQAGSTGVLWAAKNGPGTLHRLLFDGTNWSPDSANGWGAGKALHYPDGTGDPDAEGVTLTDAGSAGGIFVSTERNNSANTVSRPEILRFDATGAATSLNATMEWNLTSDLPPVAANSGLEALSFIPDGYLVANGFFDEHTGAAYSPSTYANHGTGLFFAGLEANGTIYGYALNQADGTFTRVATFASGFVGVMDLNFEPETGKLWAVCDDTCNGRSATLTISKSGGNIGHFAVTAVYERPASMPNYNNEGFAIAPQSLCVTGAKPVFWSDDTNDDSHAIRSGTISCTAGATGQIGLEVTSIALVDGQLSLSVPSGAKVVFAAATLVNGLSTSTATLPKITVTDDRQVSKPGWTLNQTVATFVKSAGDTTPIEAKQLGVKPSLVTGETTSVGVILGTEQVAGAATNSSSLLARAASGNGTGTSVVSGDLKLVAPAGSPAGTYKSTMTLTLIGS